MSGSKKSEKELAARRLEAERLAVKALEKESLDRQQQALRRQKEFREKTQIWNEQILPRWHDLFQGNASDVGHGWSGFIGGSGGAARVRDLCHKGIPPNIRGKVWPLMIKNDLKIDGEMFEHLNRKVIQIYGVNLSANKPRHPEDQLPQKNTIYRDSFLGLFDEAHPLYPKDNSPAGKGMLKLTSGGSAPGSGAGTLKFPARGAKSSDEQEPSPTDNAPQERQRTVSVMKRANSLSNLTALVTSGDKEASFRLRLSPMRGACLTADLNNGTEHSPGSASPAVSHQDSGADDPADPSVVVTLPVMDVTEEPWFQNERNGSLDQSAFEFVQKQLFEGEIQAERRKSAVMSTIAPSVNLTALSAAAAQAAEAESDAIVHPGNDSPSGAKAPLSPVTTSVHSSAYRTATPTPPKSLSPAPFATASNSPGHSSSGVPKYMDSPSLRKYRSKSEENVTATRAPEHTSNVTRAESPAPAAPGAAEGTPRADHRTDSGRFDFNRSGSYSPASTGTGRSPRVEALLASAKRDSHFFSASSDDEGSDSDDDDVIPHIIPLDLQPIDGLEGDDVAVFEEGQSGLEPGSEHVEADSTRRLSAETGDSELVGLDLLSSPESVRSRTNGRHRIVPDGAYVTETSSSILCSEEGAPQTPDNRAATAGQGVGTPPHHDGPAWLAAVQTAGHYIPSPGLDSNAATPPPRSKHSREYLVEAGLVRDAENQSQEQRVPSAGRPPSALGSQSGSRQRPGMLFPSADHSPQHSYAHRSPSQNYAAQRTPSASRDVRSFSRQSIEDMLHHALTERETEGSLLAPTQSRFSFQASSSSLRLGSIDGSAQLLHDELIAVRDDNYFPSPTEGAEKAATQTGTNGTGTGTGAGQQAVLDEESQALIEEQNLQLLSSMSLIEWDLPRTYPTLGFFHDGGPMHTGLERVLMCYVCYRPDVGYVQGMSYLVATLLLYMDEFEAFKCLANLLGRRLNMDFYKLQKEGIEAYVLCFNFFFEKMLPLLYEHFRQEGVTSEMFLMDWMMSLFTKTLPLEVAAHIWDVYLYEGEMYLMCVALGILKLYAPRLCMFTVEKVSPFLLHLPDDIKPEELFNCIAQIRISRKRYDRIRLKMAVKVYGSIEAYEKANVTPEPVHIPGLRPSPSATGLASSVHVVSTKRPFTKEGSGNSSPAGGALQPHQGTFWQRRQGANRKGVLDSFLSRWLQGSKDDSSGTRGAKKAGGNYGANGKPRANSLLYTSASQK